VTGISNNRFKVQLCIPLLEDLSLEFLQLSTFVSLEEKPQLCMPSNQNEVSENGRYILCTADLFLENATHFTLHVRVSNTQYVYMADNFVTKEPALIVTVSGEVADEIYVLSLVLKQSLALTNLKKIERLPWQKLCSTRRRLSLPANWN
jgi:hypothetical protein